MRGNDAAIFDRVLPYVTNFTTAIDVGANEGVWSKAMATRFNTIHCFEPNLFLCSRLANWAVDASCDVKVHNIALSDFSGKGSLYFSEGSPDKMRGCFVKEDASGDVEVRTLDSFRIRGCGLLKIDVEGAELLVIRSARRIIRHQRPVVVVEHKNRTSARYGWNLGDLLRYMRELKYHLAFGVDPNLVFVR